MEFQVDAFPSKHRVDGAAEIAASNEATEGTYLCVQSDTRGRLRAAWPGDYHGLHGIGVTVVDADALSRDGIKAIVAGQPEMRVLDETSDVDAALASLRRARPDVIVVEAWMASENDGAAIRAMLHSLPSAKIIAFGLGSREEEIFHVLDAGASGYLLRSAIRTDLVTAIRRAQSGDRYIPPEVERRFRRRQRRPQLTPRERTVLSLLARARSNAAIAAVLGISIGTVKLHVKSVLAKLGVEDRAEAAVVALERGFARVT
jgi:DNA-binding NarL/FixJ family response regulator